MPPLAPLPLPLQIDRMRIAPAFRLAALLGLITLFAAPSHAIVRGQVSRDPNGLRQFVVRVESSRGELCSGVLIGPDVVLTAAHCLTDRAAYWIVANDRAFRQRRVNAIGVVVHPAFVAGTTPRTQPGVDLALLKLERPLGPDFQPLSPSGAGIGTGDLLTIAGYGVVGEGQKGSARVLRQTSLVSLGPLQVANRVLVAVDPERMAGRTGAGACRGDSGGPILGAGAQLVGIVSWSSGAFEERRAGACGGFTAMTPLSEHGAWVAQSAQSLSRIATVPAGTRYTSR
jgi:S1-C subfamily serine protease